MSEETQGDQGQDKAEQAAALLAEMRAIGEEAKATARGEVSERGRALANIKAARTASGGSRPRPSSPATPGPSDGPKPKKRRPRVDGPLPPDRARSFRDAMKASRAGGGAEAPIGQQAEFANPAAGRPRPAPPDPKAVEAFGAAVAAQARSAVRGGIPSGEVLAAVHRAVAALCAPPPRAWHHEDGVEFTRRFAEMFADPARARSSALWRLAKDPYSTPASVYRLHVSLCAAAALLETYNQA